MVSDRDDLTLQEMVDIPHFEFPFRMSGRGAAVVEQDSSDEVVQNVQLVLMTDQGSRMELPEFGIASPVFKMAGSLQAPVIQSQCEQWEPRARALIESRLDGSDELVQLIEARVSHG